MGAEKKGDYHGVTETRRLANGVIPRTEYHRLLVFVMGVEGVRNEHRTLNVEHEDIEGHEGGAIGSW